MNQTNADREGCCSAAMKSIAPRCNVYEDTQGYSMWFAMPGVEQSGLEMWVDKGLLHLTGKAAECCQRGEVLRAEFTPVNYNATYRLGEAVDVGGIQAELKNGLLRVTLPKSEASRPRKISVRTE